MNSKKRGKRGPKFNPKLNRGSQHRRPMEGKSNIGVKRVTLLPGFLINGFSSDTAKKTKGLAQEHYRAKDHLLTENLESFLERKSHLRRSERILKKHSKGNDSSDLRSSLSNAALDSCPRSVSIKSILKKNSKSIFKEISDKFSKVYVEKHNEQTLPEANQTMSSTSEESIDLTEKPHIYNPNRHFTELLYNRSICEDFFSKIHVSFKKNAIEECQENIKREISLTNLVLEGKIKRTDPALYDSEDNDSEIKDNNMLPVPEKNWVYCTPRNQKITIPQAEECQLKPGMICVDKNHRNIYEFDSGKYVRSQTPMFSKPNFGPNRGATNMYPLEVLWAPANDIGVSMMPSYLNTNNHYLTSEIQTPETLGNYAEDFTFIGEENNFKMQASQPLLHRKKRPLIDEEEFVTKKNTYAMDRCENKPKMFDFNSQDRNVFDFGVIG